MEDEDQLLLKWDDHHKSFFSLASELMDREELIDVTLLAGESSFPAHKLILSICSPYFRSLFVRNPCSHPMVVLKDVEPKYMRLLLLYMYEGQVACPSMELSGLLATAKSLQIRGLLELEKKRRRASSSTDEMPSAASPGILLNNNNNNHILGDEIMKNEEQPLDMQVHPSSEAAEEHSHHSHHSHHSQHTQQPSSPRSQKSNSHNHGNSNPFHFIKGGNNGNMLPPNALDPSDPMASMNALLAAAASQQVQQTQHPIGGGEKTPKSKSETHNASSNEMNQAAAMANKVAGMGGSSPSSGGPTSSNSPKERKECHVCGKTLYDRSTWNRHMRIHTGEKPYPCRFCGRRFRTNYNKLGHEKKCPDRHNGEGGGGGGGPEGGERGSGPTLSSTNGNNSTSTSGTSTSGTTTTTTTTTNTASSSTTHNTPPVTLS